MTKAFLTVGFLLRSRFVALLTVVLLFSGCQTDDFSAPEYRQSVVVDGWIEQGQPARVLLTLSSPFFANIDSASLRDLIITRAKVTVSDGSQAEVLTLFRDDRYFPPYVYRSTSIKGTVGGTYSLKVEYQGREITAVTQIPQPQAIDDIQFEKNLDSDTLGSMKIRFTDRPNVDDYYRILNKIGFTGDFEPVFLPNIDGRLIEGKTVNVFVAPRVNGKMAYYTVGDTVNLRFCVMDKAGFEFWSSIHQTINSSQNPFASSNMRVKSNVVGGMGGWVGYGVSNYKFVCK